MRGSNEDPTIAWSLSRTPHTRNAASRPASAAEFESPEMYFPTSSGASLLTLNSTHSFSPLSAHNRSTKLRRSSVSLQSTLHHAACAAQRRRPSPLDPRRVLRHPYGDLRP